jgi:dolichol-phosphate mannosyltransferase
MMHTGEILVFFPTLDERENVQALHQRLRAVLPEVRILVIDDQSTDGTLDVLAQLAREDERFSFRVRGDRRGVGSAHIEAIQYAREHGFDTLVTLDGDFAHKPEDIPRFLSAAEDADIVIGDRFLQEASLREWALSRRVLTHLRHWVVRLLLRIDHDASGAFRVYRLSHLDPRAFDGLDGTDYEFFFESLALFDAFGARIASVPIDLPARVYGTSKMRIRHVGRALVRVFVMAWRLIRLRRRIARERPAHGVDPEDWNTYWSERPRGLLHRLYARIAKVYRVHLIEPSARAILERHLSPGGRVLHAGSGSGQTDSAISRSYDLVACDLSEGALARYTELNGPPAAGGPKVLCADIRSLPFQDESFDGVYNLGVMEHFPAADIPGLLREFDRILRPSGTAVLFWPPVYAPSVLGLGALHAILRMVGGKDIQLHPPEPTKLIGRRQISGFLEGSCLELCEMHIGPRDLFTYCAVVVRKASDTADSPTGLKT